MVKRIFAFTLVVIIATAAAMIPVSASTVDIESDTMRYGSAIIDGIVDDEYLQSLSVKIAPPKYAGDETTNTAEVYALHDDEYVYICYVVKDNSLTSAKDDYIMSDAHPSVNDAVELRIGSADDGVFPAYTSSPDHHLFMMDAYGKRISCYKDSMDGYEGAAVIADDKKSYTVEIAIPIDRALKDGETIKMNFQIDDLQLDGKCGYIGAAEAYNKMVAFKVSEEEVVVVTEEEAPTAQINAPSTADPIFAAALVLIAGGTAVTLGKKRK